MKKENEIFKQSILFGKVCNFLKSKWNGRKISESANSLERVFEKEIVVAIPGLKLITKDDFRTDKYKQVKSFISDKVIKNEASFDGYIDFKKFKGLGLENTIISQPLGSQRSPDSIMIDENLNGVCFEMKSGKSKNKKWLANSGRAYKFFIYIFSLTNKTTAVCLGLEFEANYYDMLVKRYGKELENLVKEFLYKLATKNPDDDIREDMRRLYDIEIDLVDLEKVKERVLPNAIFKALNHYPRKADYYDTDGVFEPNIIAKNIGKVGDYLNSDFSKKYVRFRFDVDYTVR